MSVHPSVLSSIHPLFILPSFFYFFLYVLFLRYWIEVKLQCKVSTCKMLVLFFTMCRCQVEGCNRGFDSAPRLRRHMKIHNKGECDQIVWLFYIVYMYLIYLPLKGDVLFFHVILRCLVVDFSFTYFGRKKRWTEWHNNRIFCPCLLIQFLIHQQLPCKYLTRILPMKYSICNPHLQGAKKVSFTACHLGKL